MLRISSLSFFCGIALIVTQTNQQAAADIWGDIADQGRVIVDSGVRRYARVNGEIARAYDLVERTAAPYVQRYFPQYADRAAL